MLVYSASRIRVCVNEKLPGAPASSLTIPSDRGTPIVNKGEGYVDDGRGHIAINESALPATDVSVILAPVSDSRSVPISRHARILHAASSRFNRHALAHHVQLRAASANVRQGTAAGRIPPCPRVMPDASEPCAETEPQ